MKPAPTTWGLRGVHMLPDGYVRLPDGRRRLLTEQLLQESDDEPVFAADGDVRIINTGRERLLLGRRVPTVARVEEEDDLPDAPATPTPPATPTGTPPNTPTPTPPATPTGTPPNTPTPTPTATGTPTAPQTPPLPAPAPLWTPDWL